MILTIPCNQTSRKEIYGISPIPDAPRLALISRACTFSSLGVFGMTGKNQWVVPINGGNQWGVRGEGNERTTSIHDTQREAIDRARGIPANEQSELLIQGRDGQIRERNSYGDDPFPPKG